MSKNWKGIEHRIYTMCMIQRNNEVLLINRPDHRGFPGYIAPGGKVDFPESIVQAAIRESKEETGLHVSNLIFKGLDEYVNPKENVRYMVFNYWTDSFDGELPMNPPEGELLWVPIDTALNLPMQDWFKERFPLFFEKGTFEIQRVWDRDLDKQVAMTIIHT
ncbi:DNA mismatch repair protein MutT [Bacillus cereus]|uniref:DNA mismatch repair protein MutT n=1 Tax=Bacillus cereus TaxID=1396 RepID=A0A2B3YT02_BACCE|nr:8-oxo-dGTP diphosphatase [Bacillus cereus]PFC77266.1 DNA mismatch repair protein MutT [Bacillus cereus]PFD68705.1 DNA mismatch repair protein MutT [Bacillus cereus]PFP62168.1 DNA mismatch repair protein MutT [Bacillus cereus]PFV01109.1 DNA mismatch repair protein MutT [Bacillus cereus]PGK46333.1 DNA mismatch repair protein MutT [Bacillus cereus]